MESIKKDEINAKNFYDFRREKEYFLLWRESMQNKQELQFQKKCEKLAKFLRYLYLKLSFQLWRQNIADEKSKTELIRFLSNKQIKKGFWVQWKAKYEKSKEKRILKEIQQEKQALEFYENKFLRKFYLHAWKNFIKLRETKREMKAIKENLKKKVDNWLLEYRTSKNLSHWL